MTKKPGHELMGDAIKHLNSLSGDGTVGNCSECNATHEAWDDVIAHCRARRDEQMPVETVTEIVDGLMAACTKYLAAWPVWVVEFIIAHAGAPRIHGYVGEQDGWQVTKCPNSACHLHVIHPARQAEQETGQSFLNLLRTRPFPRGLN